MKRSNFVPWESVDVGDEIAATFKADDMTVTNQGTVGTVESHGKVRTFYTSSGMRLFSEEIGAPKQCVIVMLNKRATDWGRLF